MAQQQQNITIAAPGFQGLNTEDSPLQQDPGFCLVADNAVVDKFGRIGSRKPFKEFTTEVDVVFSVNAATVETETQTHRVGSGDINGTVYVLTTVSVRQYDAADQVVQRDDFICVLTEAAGPTYKLVEVPHPVLTDETRLEDAQIVSFNDAIYIFSKGNETLRFNGSTIAALSSSIPYIPPQNDSGNLTGGVIDGDVATGAYGRLWVSGVGGDYQTIWYSDLLIPSQWYDGKATPTDPLNTAGFINVNEFWPAGADRIVALVAHNNSLYVFGRQSILVYANAASGDPAGADGIFLQDTITSMGAVNRDAIANIGSDVLFVDDSGVRSLGRTIQEKSVPIGDLTTNIRRDLTDVIAATADKTQIALSYWPDESKTVISFSGERLAYVMEMRVPSVNGSRKVTRWTNVDWERAHYYETKDEARILLASHISDLGLLLYANGLSYNGEPFEFKYESNALTFGQPANSKFLKQIDYTVVSTFTDATAYAGWGYSGRLDYSKLLTVTASDPALYNVAYYNQGAEYGEGTTTIRRYRVNTKGSGEAVIIGFRANIEGNTASLQEINVQTLLGRLN